MADAFIAWGNALNQKANKTNKKIFFFRGKFHLILLVLLAMLGFSIRRWTLSKMPNA